MLKPSQVAKRFSVAHSTVISWIENGVRSRGGTLRRLAATRAGRSWRIEPDDLEVFLQRIEADEPKPEPVTPRQASKIQRKIDAEQEEAKRLMADW